MATHYSAGPGGRLLELFRHWYRDRNSRSEGPYDLVAEVFNMSTNSVCRMINRHTRSRPVVGQQVPPPTPMPSSTQLASPILLPSSTQLPPPTPLPSSTQLPTPTLLPSSTQLPTPTPLPSSTQLSLSTTLPSSSLLPPPTPLPSSSQLPSSVLTPPSKSVQMSTTQSPETVPLIQQMNVYDEFTIGNIRRFVHQKFSAKQNFTISTLTKDLKKEGIIPQKTSETSLWRILHKMGFRYKTAQRKIYARRESLDIVCKRIGALRSLRQFREEGREVVYVDETWFTTRMSHNKEWVDSTQPFTSATYSRLVPPGEGERFVVVAAGTSNGFVNEAFLCYAARNSSGDYHGEMNAQLFLRWLTMQLLPSLEEPSVLVIDNAPYHSQLTEGTHCPNTATKRDDLIRWLERHNIPYPPYAKRPELLSLCKENRPPPQYTVDNTIREWGHEVVRLPPAHPELNAIEQVWGVMKRYVRSSLHRFTRADLMARLEEAKLCATKELWAGAIKRSEAFEREYWLADNVHDIMDPVIITLSSEDEEHYFILDDADL
ncbi:uncharacterized protein [Macrobrachium rosenbergii]|uniref:uncharacterized protein n=1 Tax=Macrobrachium rosenbergii TaxID=79674 RepID=UPI0034D3F1D9